MTRLEQLDKVKDSLNMKGNALDNTLLIFIDEVKYYLSDAGVSQSVIESENSTGCICRGVSDLYINGELSQYFYQRVTQLAMSEV